MFKLALLLSAWLCLGGAALVSAQAGRNLREKHRRTTSTAYTGRIARFELVDTETDNVVVSSLTNGMIITSSKQPSYSIHAVVVNNASPRTNRVDFSYDFGNPDLANPTYERIEYGAPYAMCGNSGRNFFRCHMLGYGRHYVNATPRHSSTNSGAMFGVTFTIVEAPANATAASLRAQAITSFINNITLTGQTLTGPTLSMNGTTTIADPVLRFLIEEDPLQLSAKDTPADRFRLQQRYAALKLLVPTHGMIPKYIQSRECDWGTSDLIKVYPTCVTKNLGGIDQSVVDEIYLYGLYGRGTLALTEELGLFSHLRRFDVSNTDLVGSLPSTIGLWTALEEFMLNGVTSKTIITIPGNLGKWTRLQKFNWDDDFSTLFSTGTLSSDIGRWTNLTSFKLAGENISGTIPTSIGAWSNLEYFQVRRTAIHGTLPATIGYWNKLQLFHAVHSPALRGTLPDVIGNWNKLQFFEVYDTSITGTIPESVRQWTDLNYANFAATNLTGSVPASLCNVTSLRFLDADCLSEVTCQCCSCY